MQAPPENRRLHPMTLVQRILVSIPGLFILLLPFLRAPDQEAWISLVAAVLYGTIALPLIVLRYYRFRYRITPREVVIRSGVMTRRDRSIPIERIQNIEIEQSLLPRLFGTAKVKIETAGSASTEGVLELVSLAEAHRIRQIVRSYQQAAAPAPGGAPAAVPPPAEAPATPAAGEHRPETAAPPLFTMPLSRVLLSGMFRFSLLYIVLTFSALEYLNLTPEEVVDWFERGRFRPLTAFAAASPWLLALASVLLAALLSWISGILVNLNRFYGFTLTLEDGKLHRRYGLFTVAERTLPLKKIQTLIFRSNPLMRHFGWWRLELQTMGLDVEQHGHQIAVPFARWDDLLRLAPHFFPLDLPEAFHPVSRLMIRRTATRYTLAFVTLVLAGAYFWRPALWALTALPLLWYLALLQYRSHGYAVRGDVFYIRRGVFLPHLWAVPLERAQVFYTSASVFQRRLGLQSLHIDTAGAGGFLTPEVVDLPAAAADEQIQALYAHFQRLYAQRRRAAPASTGRALPGFDLERPQRQQRQQDS